MTGRKRNEEVVMVEERKGKNNLEVCIKTTSTVEKPGGLTY